MINTHAVSILSLRYHALVTCQMNSQKQITTFFPPMGVHSSSMFAAPIKISNQHHLVSQCHEQRGRIKRAASDEERKQHYKKICARPASCEHGRRKSRCKDCGGSGICVHGRQKAHCKEGCGGSALCVHGRQKSRCKECGGSGICEHGKLKCRCRRCGGSGLCEHGRQKSSCRECLPLEKLLAMRHFCNICGVTHVNPRRRTVCAGCDTTAKQRTEHVVWEMLQPLLHHPPSSRDNTMVGARAGASECAGVNTTGGSCGQRRPDVSWVCHGRNRVVYLEIDEHSHRDRQVSCELSKVDDTAFSQVSATDGTLLRGVFIRFNPDAYDEHDVPLADRVLHLAEVIKWECTRATRVNEQHDVKPRVVFMYYHSSAHTHIRAARSSFGEVLQLPRPFQCHA